MLRPAAIAALAVLAAACSGGGSAPTVTVAGRPVAVGPLVDAHAALCEGAARPDAARRLFFDRAHDPLHTVAAALEDVDRARAAELLEAKERVESELAEAPAGLAGDLRRLAGVYRDGLGRLAITAPPCVE